MTVRPVDRHRNTLHRSGKISEKPAPAASRKGLGWKYLLAVFLLSCIGVAGTYYYLYPPCTIDVIRVHGQYPHVSQSTLSKTLTPYANDTLLSIRTSTLQKTLEHLPWIEKASVHRIWPHTLHVVLHEPVIVARIGATHLLTQSGRLVPLTTDYATLLPILNITPQTLAPHVVFDQYKHLETIVTPLKLHIIQINIDARGTWEIFLSNGIRVVLGRTDQQQRLQRLAAVYTRVFGDKGGLVDYVDMRYTNGMAVHWKPAAS